MKDKLTIQRNWDSEWFTPYAEAEGLSEDFKFAAKAELRKEVYWIATFPMNEDLESSISIRISKIENLAAQNSGSASSFDPYFEQRKLFFEWAIA